MPRIRRLSKTTAQLTRYQQSRRRDVSRNSRSIRRKQLSIRTRAIMLSDQGNLDNAKVQLVYCSITSPMTGRIGLRQVDPGNFVQPSRYANGLAVITQLQPITVIFTIADVDIPKVMGDSSTVPSSKLTRTTAISRRRSPSARFTRWIVRSIPRRQSSNSRRSSRTRITPFSQPICKRSVAL